MSEGLANAQKIDLYEQFGKAHNFVKNQDLSDDSALQMRMYSLYKLVMYGPYDPSKADEHQPLLEAPVFGYTKDKWLLYSQEWQNISQMEIDSAITEYIAEVKKINPDWSDYEKEHISGRHMVRRITFQGIVYEKAGLLGTWSPRYIILCKDKFWILSDVKTQNFYSADNAMGWFAHSYEIKWIGKSSMKYALSLNASGPKKSYILALDDENHAQDLFQKLIKSKESYIETESATDSFLNGISKENETENGSNPNGAKTAESNRVDVAKFFSASVNKSMVSATQDDDKEITENGVNNEEQEIKIVQSEVDEDDGSALQTPKKSSGGSEIAMSNSLLNLPGQNDDNISVGGSAAANDGDSVSVSPMGSASQVDKSSSFKHHVAKVTAIHKNVSAPPFFKKYIESISQKTFADWMADKDEWKLVDYANEAPIFCVNPVVVPSAKPKAPKKPTVFKTYSSFEADLKVLIYYLTNPSGRKQWDSNIEEQRIIYEFDDNTQIVYQKNKQHTKPFFTRDFVFMRHTIKIGQLYVIVEKSCSNSFPVDSGCVRGEVLESTYVIKPHKHRDNQFLVLWNLQVDQKLPFGRFFGDWAFSMTQKMLTPLSVLSSSLKYHSWMLQNDVNQGIQEYITNRLDLDQKFPQEKHETSFDPRKLLFQKTTSRKLPSYTKSAGFPSRDFFQLDEENKLMQPDAYDRHEHIMEEAESDGEIVQGGHMFSDDEDDADEQSIPVRKHSNVRSGRAGSVLRSRGNSTRSNHTPASLEPLPDISSAIAHKSLQAVDEDDKPKAKLLPFNRLVGETVVELLKVTDKNGLHFMYKDNYERHDQLGLKFVNDEAMKAQRGVLGYFLKKASTALLSGKSIFAISMPIQVFEAKSYLQRLADSFGYAPVFLKKAGMVTDPIESLKYIITYCVCTLHLTTEQKKPFNPILGETLQGKLGDAYLFLEQTSHHPPVSHFQVFDEHFVYSGYSEIFANMGANSVKGGDKGKFNLKIQGRTISWHVPDIHIEGLLWGDRNFNWSNTLKIRDETNDLYGEVVFNPDKKTGFFSKGKQETPADTVRGHIWKVNDWAKFQKNRNAPGVCEVLCKIDGRWTEILKFDDEVFWELENYRPYVVVETKNVLESDARKREDLIAFLTGDEDVAQSEKEKLENIQRADRKFRASLGPKKKKK